jgi:hypothetical protein
MKKIKISAGYDTSENLTERLIKQFKTPDIDLSEIEFVFDESYDIIIFFNYVNENIVEGSKSFLFPHEPSWNGSHQKSFSDGTTVFGFSQELYSGDFIESVAHTFYGGRGPWVDTLDFWNYETLIESKFIKSKTISSSITRLNSNFGQPCIYPQRYEILQKIKKNNSIDIFDGDISPKRKDALVDYKFNISIENSYEKNWITEKFYDNILTNTIPIYFGCKNIKDIYPEDGYILIDDINDIDGVDKLLKEIINNSDEIYNQKIKGLEEIKIKYFKEKNILNKIKNLL